MFMNLKTLKKLGRECNQLFVKFRQEILDLSKVELDATIKYGFLDKENEINDLFKSDKRIEHILEEHKKYYDRLDQIVRRINFLEMMNKDKYYYKVLNALEKLGKE